MADENQELQRQMEELRNSFQGLNTATKDANVGLDAFKKKLPGTLADVAKGMGSFAANAAKGDTGLKSMTAVVDVAANAISGLAKTVPIFGEALSAATKAVAEGAKIVVEQLDQTAKTFNAMAASGATVADGMTGLSRQFQTAGLNMQQFQKVVGQNAQALARFKGVAGDGAEEFSKAVGNLTQKQDTDLRKIGMSAEDIAGTTAAFVTQQTRLGKSQSMSTEQLTAGAKQYALELDQLSKVTGLSREAIQKQQDAALSESRFRANYELMMANGQEKQAKAMMTLQTRMSTFGPEMGQAVRDLSGSGVANTEASQKLVRSTGGAAMDIMARLKEGSIDQDQAQNELISAMERTKKAQMDIASTTGSTTGTFLEMSSVSDAINAKNEGAYEKAAKTQSDQIKNTDDLTKSTAKAQQNLEAMNVGFSVMATKLMPAASKAIEGMTNSMKEMVKWSNKQFGGGGGSGGSGAPSGGNAPSGGGRGAPSGGSGAPSGGNAPSGGGRGSSGATAKSAAAKPTGATATSSGGSVSGLTVATAPSSGGGGTDGQSAEKIGSNAAPPPKAVASKTASKGGSSMSEDDIKKMIIAHEGKRYEPYKDSLGLWTVGVGHLIGDGKSLPPEWNRKLSEEEVMKLFEDDYAHHRLAAQSIPGFGKLGTSGQGALTDLTFNMGPSWIQKWPKLKKQLTDLDVESAASNLEGSKWFGQVKSRGPEIVDMLRNSPVSAANGAILSGPTSGYQPNLTMHGTEAIVPLNSPAAESMGMGNSENTNLMAAQLERLEEMVSVMKNQLSVSTKILQHAS
jgi:GH24 family phage-related lysozyme (muramidase)